MFIVNDPTISLSYESVMSVFHHASFILGVHVTPRRNLFAT